MSLAPNNWKLDLNLKGKVDVQGAGISRTPLKDKKENALIGIN